MIFATRSTRRSSLYHNANTKAVQIFRSTSSTVDLEADAVGSPVAVSPSRSYSQPIGDTTRENLLANSTMDSLATWTLGTGWTIAAGVASHAAGTAGALSQALAATTGKYYRVAFDVSGLTAGSLTPQLTGGSTRAGTPRSANGSYSDRIQAVTGNNTAGWLASSGFDGSLDNAVAYLETETCLDQGTQYFWLQPQNSDGVPGPLAGPFSVVIR